MEINPISGSTIKTYIYADSQILMQNSSSFAAPRCFYLSDRLGSVRETVDTTGAVKAYLTYNPFGETLENSGPFLMVTSFRFAGQYYDTETGQYYLRARQYDPYIGRFTTRDLIDGKFEEPMTLHKYLYCGNDPINKVDLMGRWSADIHNQLINEAFSGIFSSVERGSIERGSAYVDDEYSAKEYSFMHAMRAGGSWGRSDRSVGEARALMQGFIVGNLINYEEFKSYGSSCYRALAFSCLGMALHPVMDSTSPAHEGFQRWYGLFTADAYKHWKKEEVITPQRRQEAISRMLSTMWLDLDPE
jgi:RHS repeat-associated protein